MALERAKTNPDTESVSEQDMDQGIDEVASADDASDSGSDYVMPVPNINITTLRVIATFYGILFYYRKYIMELFLLP